MEKVWANVKQHKFLYGGVAVGALLIFYVLGHSGSVSATSSDPNATAADNSLQEAQLAAQTQQGQTAAAANASSEQTAAGLHVADLQAGLQYNAQTLQANIADEQLSDSLQALTVGDTLQAQTTQYGEAQQTQQLEITTNGQVAQTSLLTGALIKQAQIQGNEVTTISNNQAATAQQSLVSKLFG